MHQETKFPVCAMQHFHRTELALGFRHMQCSCANIHRFIHNIHIMNIPKIISEARDTLK